MPIIQRGDRVHRLGRLLAGASTPPPADDLDRARYGGSASRWGFAIYRASHDDYEDSFLPSEDTAGSPQEALGCACGLYLNDPTAWQRDTPTN